MCLVLFQLELPTFHIQMHQHSVIYNNVHTQSIHMVDSVTVTDNMKQQHLYYMYMYMPYQLYQLSAHCILCNTHAPFPAAAAGTNGRHDLRKVINLCTMAEHYRVSINHRMSPKAHFYVKNSWNTTMELAKLRDTLDVLECTP